MIEDLENLPARSGLASRRFRKRLLAVRAMAGETAWLDGRMTWYEGRVAWETPRGPFSPGPGDLALAQRRLGQIADSPRAAARALDDAPAWLARRVARLEIAKQLHTVAEPDLPALVARVQVRDPHATRRLAALLPAEAICLNDLPLSPSAALLLCGGHAGQAVADVLADERAPVPGRALAGLLLGALHRQSALRGSGSRPVEGLDDAGRLRRAYNRGLRSGLPSCPALTGAILEDPDGDSLARRCEAVLSRGPFALPPQVLRDMLAGGVPTATVVATAEAAAHATTGLQHRILSYRDELPSRDPRKARERREVAEQLQVQRQELVSGLSEALRGYLLAAPDPGTAGAFVLFVEAMLDLGKLTPELGESMLLVLRLGLPLPAPLQVPYLRLLAEEHGRIWDGPGYTQSVKSRNREDWLRNRHANRVPDVVALLRVTGDAEIVREALELGVYGSLASSEWPDPDMYQFAMSLIRSSGLTYWPWRLEFILEGFSTARAARTALQPLAQVTANAPEPIRANLFAAILEHLAETRKAPRVVLPRLVAYVPAVERFAQAYGPEYDPCDRLLEAAMALDKAHPDKASTWFDWVMSHLLITRPFDSSDYYSSPLSLAVPLGIALADGDLACFQAVVKASLKHSFKQDYDLLCDAISALSRYPHMRSPLAHIFPHQPHRAADLLLYLGLLSRFGPEAAAPLDALDRSPGTDPPILPPDWHPLFEALPGMAPTFTAYLRACQFLDTPAVVPPGVRRALEQPTRLARELAYLESRPDLGSRPELAARVTNLRARLADGETVSQAARAEAAEALEHVAAEAQLATLERQVMLCYRARLEKVASPLPPDLSMSEDLMNATLLTADIQQNRRLLLKLLRAYVRGDHHWPELHPTNIAFLEDLAEHGVDKVAWLDSMPRTYRCPGVAGGRVRLHLETDPLHVLQMGNYFDTCLSFGQFNAFSTVANACELNKRVIYAHDGSGQVVGRKLIGVNKEWALVGFRTYISLPDNSAGPLRAIFTSYASDFASGCHLDMAPEGTVPSLFASWYDDGTVPWTEEPPALDIRNRQDAKTPRK
ncbi:MAG: hypothetical protein ACJ78Q_07850 [Chloroflexia bacterium]